MTQTPISLSDELIGGDGEAELVGWLVGDGSDVALDDAVAELSTSKAIIEVPAPAAGRLTQLVTVGTTVLPDQPIATIEH